MISIKNITLPNKLLSNLDLEDASRKLKIPFFRGVFLLDTLPRKPNKKECGIVNFNKSDGPGTHWVAWYKNGKTKIYFDSYGIQLFCGHLCLYVLKELSAGREFRDILNKLF